MARTVITKILLRNDTAATWASKNPVLGKGEAGVEVDTGLVKFGDGTSTWSSLKYAGYTKQSQLVNDDHTVKDADYASIKSKVNGIASGAQVNVIESVKVNGTALTPSSKAVNVTVTTGSGDGTIAVNGTDVVIKNFSNKANKATTLAGYGISDAYTRSQTDSAIASAVASVFKYRGTKKTTSELPSSGQTVGDVYFVSADSSEYAWNGEKWEELGPTIDLSHFITSISIAGLTLSSSATSITQAQLRSALGLGAAAYLGVYKSTDSTAPSNGDAAVPTVSEMNKMIADAKISADSQLILDCGTSATEVV